jgi:hypothetical protein
MLVARSLVLHLETDAIGDMTPICRARAGRVLYEFLETWEGTRLRHIDALEKQLSKRAT